MKHTRRLGTAAVGVATVAGFGRLFEDWDFLVPITIVTLGAHALAAATRRRGEQHGAEPGNGSIGQG